MALSISLSLSLYLISLVASTPVEPMITSSPILPRQESIDYSWIGYYTTTDARGSVSLGQRHCYSDEAFFTSGSVVDCCPTAYSGWESDCTSLFPTSCSDSVIYYGTTSATCSDDMYCDPDTVFPYSTADAFGKLWYGCSSGYQKVYFQEKPDVAAITTADSSSTFHSSSASPRTLPSSTPQTTNIQNTSTQTPSITTEADSSGPPKEASKAWIAGAVVGGLAVIAIAGLAFYLLRNRKRSKEQTYHAAPQQPYSAEQAYGSPPQNGLSPNLSPSQEHKGYSPQNLVPQQDEWNQVYPQYGTPGPQAPVQAASPMQGHVTSPVADLPILADPPTRTRK